MRATFSQFDDHSVGEGKERLPTLVTPMMALNADLQLCY